MRRPTGAVTVAVVAVLALSHPVHGATRTDDAFRAASWLAAQQRADGTFAQGERAYDTAMALASVVAGGVGGRTVERGLDAIRRNAPDQTDRGVYTGTVIAGIVAGGANPRDFGGVDYVAKLNGQSSNGAFDSEQFFDNVLATNGALAADETLSQETLDYFLANECPDGGFGMENDCSTGPDVDTTAWSIGVLKAAGGAEDVVGRARDYLLQAQRADGGFAFTPDLETSADSTGLALAALAALGDDPTASSWRQADGDDPVRALQGLQDRSGGFRFVRSSSKPNIASTTNAIPGLAGVAYPIPFREGAAPRPVPAEEEPREDRAAPETDDEAAEPRRQVAPAERSTADERRGSAAPRSERDSREGSASAEVFPEGWPVGASPAPEGEHDPGPLAVATEAEPTSFVPLLSWFAVAVAGVGVGLAARFARRRKHG